ncbi:response regulator [Clostridium algidicarnis]|uniref:response regulator n=1 Tax=Clostridium algidicarnis TaxID=37659 RepID=UPI00162A9B6D|nr:response regulator [Clostridium algidicarnis]MBB6629929.1 response regulator [Clostridium algidicarnis]MBU3197293.1 response regulator [Clostridium algidicarnis]MCB2287679.1 response regulator [Clostridium algidicarnis]
MQKVLVVDDTKNIRMMLSTCLELEGYEVIQCKNGYDALEILEKKKLYLAFIDIKMPEISGTEVLRKIRAKGILTPVIIMTAFATVKNAVDCTKLGAMAYLQKPFTSDKIRSILKDLSKGILFDKENNASYIDMAKELLKEGKLYDAINILKTALSVEPSNAEIYYLLGKTYESYGNVKESIKFLSAAEVFGYSESNEKL